MDDPVPDGAVLYAGEILFQVNEQDCMHTEFLGNSTGNVFLAASKDHEFLLNLRGTALYISHTSAESSKPNCNYVKKYSSSSTAIM